jgi:hypothetical protein
LDALKLDNLIEEEEDAMFLILFCDNNVEVVCVPSPETVIGRHIVLFPDTVIGRHIVLFPETVIGRHIVIFPGNSPLKQRRVKLMTNVVRKLKIEMLFRFY